MKYAQLQAIVGDDLFTLVDIRKFFPEEKGRDLVTQLFRFRKKGLLQSPKQGLYCLDLSKVDEFDLANQLYRPSYISLESALNYYGMVPGVPQKVISVNPVKPKQFETRVGVFVYHRIKPALYWGYKKGVTGKKRRFFLMAEREKALLDFFYLRKIKKIDDLRLDLDDLDFKTYQHYRTYYPNWVKRIKLK